MIADLSSPPPTGTLDEGMLVCKSVDMKARR